MKKILSVVFVLLFAWSMLSIKVEAQSAKQKISLSDSDGGNRRYYSACPPRCQWSGSWECASSMAQSCTAGTSNGCGTCNN